jgi:hypothetical protein
MNVGQVKTRIAGGVRDADVAVGLLAKVKDTIDDALTGARHTTHDSRHPKVIDGLAKLGQARRDAEAIGSLLRGSAGAAEAYVRSIG